MLAQFLLIFAWLLCIPILHCHVHVLLPFELRYISPIEFVFYWGIFVLM